MERADTSTASHPSAWSCGQSKGFAVLGVEHPVRQDFIVEQCVHEVSVFGKGVPALFVLGVVTVSTPQGTSRVRVNGLGKLGGECQEAQ